MNALLHRHEYCLVVVDANRLLLMSDEKLPRRGLVEDERIPITEAAVVEECAAVCATMIKADTGVITKNNQLLNLERSQQMLLQRILLR